MTTITLIDDNLLFRAGVRSALEPLKTIKVISEFASAEDMIKELASGKQIPGIIILSSHNLIGNSNKALKTIKRSPYYFIKVFALLNTLDDYIIGKMINDGIDGLLHKKVSEAQLRKVITTFSKTGSYKPDLPDVNADGRKINRRHWDIDTNYTRFLSLCSTDLGYGEIGEIMKISQRTAEGYRDVLFRKFEVYSRPSLVAYALKNGLIKQE